MAKTEYVWRQDIESGEWYQISRGKAEHIEAMLNQFRPKGIKGQIIITGTMSNESEWNDFKNIWNDLNSQP